MSNKGKIIIGLAVVIIIVCLIKPQKNEGFVSTAGNDEVAKNYYDSIVDLYKDETMPSQASPQSLPPIDLVTPILDCFVWYNGDGYGKVYLDLSDVKFNIGDLYFKTGKNSYSVNPYLDVIKDNEKIGQVSFTFSKKENLSSGEKIHVDQNYLRADGNFDTRLEEWWLTPIDITVPNLGSYLDYETEFTDEMLKSIKETLDDDETLEAVYYAKLKPGEYLDDEYKTKCFLFIVYNYYFGSNSRNSYAGFKNVLIYPNSSLDLETYLSGGNNLIYDGFDRAENAMYYYNDNLTFKKVWGN